MIEKQKSLQLYSIQRYPSLIYRLANLRLYHELQRSRSFGTEIHPPVTESNPGTNQPRSRKHQKINPTSESDGQAQSITTNTTACQKLLNTIRTIPCNVRLISLHGNGQKIRKYFCKSEYNRKNLSVKVK